MDKKGSKRNLFMLYGPLSKKGMTGGGITLQQRMKKQGRKNILYRIFFM